MEEFATWNGLLLVTIVIDSIKIKTLHFVLFYHILQGECIMKNFYCLGVNPDQELHTNNYKIVDDDGNSYILYWISFN